MASINALHSKSMQRAGHFSPAQVSTDFLLRQANMSSRSQDFSTSDMSHEGISGFLDKTPTGFLRTCHKRQKHCAPIDSFLLFWKAMCQSYCCKSRQSSMLASHTTGCKITAERLLLRLASDYIKDNGYFDDSRLRPSPPPTFCTS